MIFRKKTVIFILLLSLISTSLLTGCKEDVVEEKYDFTILLDDYDDPIKLDALLTEYASDTGIKIKVDKEILSNKDVEMVKSRLAGNEPPAIFAMTYGMDKDLLLEEGYISDEDSLPYIAEGYGLSVDTRLLDEIFGSKNTKKLIKDIKAADYSEWELFVKKIDNYIKKNELSTISLNGNKYKLRKKDENASLLNGVFAIAGADGTVYGNDIMDIVIQSTSVGAWEKVKSYTSPSAMKYMRQTLNTYINGLDLMTSYLAGEYSSGIRGSDFVDEELYNEETVDEAFMNGKALFSLCNCSDHSSLKAINDSKVNSLVLLPIKMPYSKPGNLNKSIPAQITHTLYVNQQLSDDTKKKATEFLAWYAEESKSWDTSMDKSVMEYIEAGNTIDYNINSEDFSEWEETVFGEDGIRRYLRKESWSYETKVEMREYMFNEWYDE